MAVRTFDGSWHNTWSNLIRQAIADVERLDRKLFSKPELGGELQKIVEKYSLEIAHLGDATAKAFEDERVENDFEQLRSVKIRMLHVTIPFKGDEWSVKGALSGPAIPCRGAAVSANHSLTITIPDDHNAEREVMTYHGQVQGNLDVLRREYERDKPQLEQAVAQAAERRKEEIARENDLDSKRSFKVLR